MICGLFTPNRYLRWAACAAAAILYLDRFTSRGSMVALSSFTIVYFTLYYGVFRAAAAGGILGIRRVAIHLGGPHRPGESLRKSLSYS